jgi:HAMP domain-containing protein
MNFGFNVKYNKGTKLQPQGHMNIIFRRIEAGVLHVYQIKSTSITSLSLGFAQACSGPPSPSCWGVSTFQSKANLADLTTGASLASGVQLVVTLTPAGRGQVVTHNLYTPERLAEIRTQFASGQPASEPDDPRPAGPRPASPHRSGVSAEQFAELEAEVAQLRTAVAQLRDELNAIRDAS